MVNQYILIKFIIVVIENNSVIHFKYCFHMLPPQSRDCLGNNTMKIQKVNNFAGYSILDLEA